MSCYGTGLRLPLGQASNSGLFALSTKEPYIIIPCPSCVVVKLASSSSADSNLSHRVRQGNLLKVVENIKTSAKMNISKYSKQYDK